jgi:YHS domain-containing protein
LAFIVWVHVNATELLIVVKNKFKRRSTMSNMLLKVGCGFVAFGVLVFAIHAADNAGDRGKPLTHGGTALSKEPYVFEVLFHPEEIRIYAYEPWPQPYSTKNFVGEVSLQYPKEEKAVRHTLKYVAASDGEQDYLSVAVDLRRPKEGKPTATVKLEDPSAAKPWKAEFTPNVVVTEPKPSVKIVELNERDKDGIVRQKVCPVSGDVLGNMGNPIKVLIDGKPLYLCCEGCVAKVKSNPETYLKKIGESPKSP